MPDLNSVTTGFFPVANKDFTDTLASTTLEDATTISVNSASEYANGEFAVWVISPGNADQVTVTGEISGNDLTNVNWTDGTAAASYPAGTTVIDYVTATHFSLVTKGAKVEHDDDGTHANVTATSIVTSGNGTVGGTLGVTGNSTLTGSLTVNNKTVKKYDESSNSVDVDPVSRNEGFQGFDYIVTGLNPSSATGLTVTIPSGTYYIAGKRYTYAGGTKLLTASKDCYLDIDTSGTITSVEVANGATSGMTLTSNSVRFAKCVTDGSGVTSYNTGVLINTAFDSIGNRIRRTNPFDKIIGYNERTSNQSSSTATDTTLSIPAVAVVPPNVYYTVRHGAYSAGAGSGVGQNNKIWDGAVTSGTEVYRGTSGSDTTALNISTAPIHSGSGATKTYNVSHARIGGSGTAATLATAAIPAYLIIEIK